MKFKILLLFFVINFFNEAGRSLNALFTKKLIATVRQTIVIASLINSNSKLNTAGKFSVNEESLLSGLWK